MVPCNCLQFWTLFMGRVTMGTLMMNTCTFPFSTGAKIFAGQILCSVNCRDLSVSVVFFFLKLSGQSCWSRMRLWYGGLLWWKHQLELFKKSMQIGAEGSITSQRSVLKLAELEREAAEFCASCTKIIGLVWGIVNLELCVGLPAL